MNTVIEPFLEFEWPVAAAYAWTDWLDSDGQPVVVPPEGLASLESCSAVELASERLEETGPVLGPSDSSRQPTRYRPMDRKHAALFRSFAEINYKDKEAIHAFATTFGLLGLKPQVQLVPRAKERPEHYAEGEPHLAWAREICWMREALRLAERRKRKDQDRLTWLVDGHLQHLEGRMKFDPMLRPRFSIVPRTLLDALWLQLALFLAGNKRFVECKFCHRLFEISTEQTGYRTHREFCSMSCKTNDYRKRKRTALQLAARGVSVGTIAEQIETKTATVRRWVSAYKAQRKVVEGDA